MNLAFIDDEEEEDTCVVMMVSHNTVSVLWLRDYDIVWCLQACLLETCKNGPWRQIDTHTHRKGHVYSDLEPIKHWKATVCVGWEYWWNFGHVEEEWVGRNSGVKWSFIMPQHAMPMTDSHHWHSAAYRLIGCCVILGNIKEFVQSTTDLIIFGRKQDWTDARIIRYSWRYQDRE